MNNDLEKKNIIIESLVVKFKMLSPNLKRTLFAVGTIIFAILLYILINRFFFSFGPVSNNDYVPPSQNKENTLDYDNDGLTNEKEIELGLNMFFSDSDNDALFDYDEVMVYKTDPMKVDTDNDGKADGLEVAQGFNPLGKGKLSSREIDENADQDGDGLIDSAEVKNGTIIFLPDSDRDGLSDGEEVLKHQTNPLKPDTDGDGHSDLEEIQSGYNPNGEGRLPSQ